MRAAMPDFRLEHLGLAARDTAALAEWYVRTLGATVRWQSEKTPAAYFVELPGGALIEIYAAASDAVAPPDNGDAGLRHLALRVASIDLARGVLEARGVIFTEPVKRAGGGGSVLFFRDGEGNLLHLVERTAESAVR